MAARLYSGAAPPRAAAGAPRRDGASTASGRTSDRIAVIGCRYPDALRPPLLAAPAAVRGKAAGDQLPRADPDGVRRRRDAPAPDGPPGPCAPAPSAGRAHAPLPPAPGPGPRGRAAPPAPRPPPTRGAPDADPRRHRHRRPRLPRHAPDARPLPPPRRRRARRPDRGR